MILQAAESFGNIDMQRAALSLIVVVVCGPYRASNMNLVSSTPGNVLLGYTMYTVHILLYIVKTILYF